MLFFSFLMPHPCSVPLCRSNYKNTKNVSVFSFPTNPELREKWLDAIKRYNFAPTKYSRVCSLHFQESDIEREASAYDPRTGRTLTAPLNVVRLKKDAVPSIFNERNSKVSLNQVGRKKTRKQFYPTLQENVTGTEPENHHLINTLKSNMSKQNENADNLKKKPSRKRKKVQSEEVTADKADNSSLKCLNNEKTSDLNVDEKNNSNCVPAVTVKVEEPWEKEYKFTPEAIGNNSLDYDKLQIEIKEVRSVSNGFSAEATEENKMGISGKSSHFERPLKILKREEIFGKLVASELSDLSTDPELYLKTKRTILDILIQAHFELINCGS